MFRTSASKQEPGLTIRRLAEFQRALTEALAAAPVEDGVSHRGEGIIQEALRSVPTEAILAWLRSLVLDPGHPGLGAEVLRLVSRNAEIGPAAWWRHLLQGALASGDVELRDAAIQAAETWSERGLADPLKSHREPVPWLREYMEAVVSDLEG